MLDTIGVDSTGRFVFYSPRTGVVMNWTKTPNAIYAAMGDMSEAELRCTMALVRNTYGWNRIVCEMTYNDFAEQTGLKSTASIAKGLAEVKTRGHFAPVEGRSRWGIASPSEVIQPENTLPSEVTSLNEVPDTLVSEVFEPVNTSLNEAIEPADTLVSEVFQYNKEREEKEREEKERENPFPFQPSPVRPAVLSPAEERVQAILAVCGLDPDVPAHVRLAENAAVQLRSYAPGYIVKRYAPNPSPNGDWHWYRDDWRGARGDMPTPAQVVDAIAKRRIEPPPPERNQRQGQGQPYHYADEYGDPLAGVVIIGGDNIW